MNRASLLTASIVAVFGLTGTADAQVSVNKIRINDSGNGANNTVLVRNGVPNFPIAPRFVPSFGNGFNPIGSSGFVTDPFQAPIYPGFGPGIPHASGMNKTIITNSGNGVGNTIVSQNRPGNFSYSFYPGPLPGFNGVNVNVIANSGNGSGNTIVTGNNGRPGAININVITNSGNGIGNTIITKNR